MYAGKVVENGRRAPRIFEAPHHPYTQGLLASIPRLGEKRGAPRGHPGRRARTRSTCPPGCLFKRRCPYAMPVCDTPPPLQQVGPGPPVALLADAERRAAGGRRRRPTPEAAEDGARALSVVRVTEPLPDERRRRPGRGEAPPVDSGVLPDATPVDDAGGRVARAGRATSSSTSRSGAGCSASRRSGPCARSTASVRRPARRDARPGRRVRLRQDHPRQGHPAPPAGHLGPGGRSMASRSSTCRRRRPARPAQELLGGVHRDEAGPTRPPGRLPGPVREPQPADDGRRDRRRGPARPRAHRQDRSATTSSASCSARSASTRATSTATRTSSRAASASASASPGRSP